VATCLRRKDIFPVGHVVVNVPSSVFARESGSLGLQVTLPFAYGYLQQVFGGTSFRASQ
jgi:hypothetical protein